MGQRIECWLMYSKFHHLQPIFIKWIEQGQYIKKFSSTNFSSVCIIPWIILTGRWKVKWDKFVKERNLQVLSTYQTNVKINGLITTDYLKIIVKLKCSNKYISVTRKPVKRKPSTSIITFHCKHLLWMMSWNLLIDTS